MKLTELWRTARRKLNLGMFLLYKHPRSIITVEGWARSFLENQAVGADLSPIPWCTYSFIHFIQSRLNSDLRIFEYGCGNSTLYYAQRVKEIVAVEHDEFWAKRIADLLPRNGQVIHKNLGLNYVEEVNNHGLFDIIIIDGRQRGDCCKAAVTALKSDGIIIYDNSDRTEFIEKSWPFLQLCDFRNLPFYGLAPITFVPTQTSIIYRRDNCLGI